MSESDMSQSEMKTKFNLGGETVTAREDYLRTITNLSYKIAALADLTDKSDVAWHYDLLTQQLVNKIIDPEDRDRMRAAKKDIYLIECGRRTKNIYQFKNRFELINSLSKDDAADAMIETCNTVYGECLTYFDKYFGFELHLAVME